MVNQKELILVVSKNMDTNKKPDRDENGLIRMASTVRSSLGFNNENVEVRCKDIISKLKVHEAFYSDIKKLKETKKYSKNELSRVGFITKDTFRKFVNNDNSNAITKGALIYRPERKKIVIDILLGADPEFLLFDNENQVVRANNVIPKAGKIGSDGAMIEVRPDPANNPVELVNNIKSIFKSSIKNDNLNSYKWIASTYHKDNIRDYPVGGHIHIGNPKNINKLESESSKFFLFSVINKILDELLALPLIKLDGTELGRFRRSECQMAAAGNNGYGFFGEWRPCDGRLEHRTLSGLWLMHPEIAESVLGSAKAIAEECFKFVESNQFKNSSFSHPDINFGDHKRLFRTEFNDWENIELAKELKCIKPSSYMSSMLNTSKARNITKTFLTTWYKTMKSLSTYKKYSTQIDKLYAILQCTRNKMIKTGFDIKKNWLEDTKLSI